MFHYTRKVGYDTGSQTLEANAWHHRSDALSSIGTVCGVGGAIFLGERWNVLDPAAAVFVSVLVMKVGLEIAWGAFHELSDESVDEEKRKTIKDAICAIDGIEDCHHIRTRSLGRYSAVDAHILVNPELTVREGHELSTSAEHAVRDAHSTAAFVTIHVEPDDGVENHVPDDVT
jgi:cation diffusion facilitator family transporter